MVYHLVDKAFFAESQTVSIAIISEGIRDMYMKNKHKY